MPKPDFAGRLPVRDDVKEVTFHRGPTESEIKFGHGAIHYITVPVEEACHRDTRFLKRWFVGNDGLHYYR